MSTRIERGLLALSIALLAWALLQRFGGEQVGAPANRLIVLTAAMVLAGVAPLARGRTFRCVLIAMSAMALLAFLFLR